MTKKERKEANKTARRAVEKPRAITSTQVEFVADALHIYDHELDVAEVEALLIEDPDITLNLYYHRGTSNTREIRH